MVCLLCLCLGVLCFSDFNFYDFLDDSGVWRSSGVGSFDHLGGAECLSDTRLDCIDHFVAAKKCLAHASRTGGICH